MEIEKTNRALAAGSWLHRDGTHATMPLQIALGTLDRQLIYRVEDGIVWLLADQALLPANQVTGSGLQSEKQVVRSFYEEFGWVKDHNGVYNDTSVFTEVRPEVEEYRRACNARIGRLLPGGTVLLDVASGAIPHPEYLNYSANYETRICVDFSLRALVEARHKLGDKGLYVIGDITCLPFASGSIDTVISLHTIYHVPQAEQTTAVDELVRVTRSGGQIVIAYVWSKSWAMDMIFWVRGWLGRLRRWGRPSPVVVNTTPATGIPALYFHPQNFHWYARDVATRHHAKLMVWSVVNTAFQNRFFTNNHVGRATIKLVTFIEQAFPWLAGRYGQYPLFLIRSRSD